LASAILGYMSSHHITLIPGDGIGPEITSVVTLILELALEATSMKTIRWDVRPVSEETYAAEGLSSRVVESIKRNQVALKGPIGTPIGTGFRSVNVALRQKLDLYCCLRPCKSFEGVATPFPNTDLVIVRENLEDLYSGIEFAAHSPEAAELSSLVKRTTGHDIAGAAVTLKPISESETRRIAHYAFSYAQEHNRKKVTIVHKANIMKETDGLFLRTAQAVSEEYPEIICEEKIIDNLCQQLVLRPETLDVLLLPNLYGDIVSDLAAGLVGGLGLAPGANIGERYAIFEATHGSAPDIAGQNKANPIALLLSGTMMLRHIGETCAAIRIEEAVTSLLKEGEVVPSDLVSAMPNGKVAGTRQIAHAIICKMGLSGHRLAAMLHDQDLLSQPWVAQGIAEFERGEFVERP